MSDGYIAELKRLEEALWRPETRLSPEWMDAVLAEDFVEFGASGRVYDRAATLVPDTGSLDVELPLPEFSARLLAPSIALVTYVSVQKLPSGADRRARRSSVWTLTDAGWKLAFHQGTLLPGGLA
jgi:hypothetical protein